MADKRREMVTVTKPEHVPEGRHWAIVVFEKLSYDDTYGGTATEHVNRYYVTDDREVWEAEVKRLGEKEGYDKKTFVAFEATKAKVTRSVTVAVL